MGRTPCCDKTKVNSGPWSPEEDKILRKYLLNHGNDGNWVSLPKKAGLKRCGKSCRLRWLNYLRPDLRRGPFTPEEDRLIYILHSRLGNRWSIIASQLAGRTDNDVKNHWNSRLKKKLMAGEALFNNNPTIKYTLNNSAHKVVACTSTYTTTFTPSCLSLEAKTEEYCDPNFSASGSQTFTPPPTSFVADHDYSFNTYNTTDHLSVSTDGSNFSSSSKTIYSSLSQPQEDSSISELTLFSMPWWDDNGGTERRDIP